MRESKEPDVLLRRSATLSLVPFNFCTSVLPICWVGCAWLRTSNNSNQRRVLYQLSYPGTDRHRDRQTEYVCIPLLPKAITWCQSVHFSFFVCTKEAVQMLILNFTLSSAKANRKVINQSDSVESGQRANEKHNYFLTGCFHTYKTQ